MDIINAYVKPKKTKNLVYLVKPIKVMKPVNV